MARRPEAAGRHRHAGLMLSTKVLAELAAKRRGEIPLGLGNRRLILFKSNGLRCSHRFVSDGSKTDLS
jgi:hypothetical protein